MAKRHTISINDEAYKKLRQKGTFGESYTTVILRLLEQIDAVKNGVKDFE
jgi:predicted CopG family antitoxin